MCAEPAAEVPGPGGWEGSSSLWQRGAGCGAAGVQAVRGSVRRGWAPPVVGQTGRPYEGGIPPEPFGSPRSQATAWSGADRARAFWSGLRVPAELWSKQSRSLCCRSPWSWPRCSLSPRYLRSCYSGCWLHRHSKPPSGVFPVQDLAVPVKGCWVGTGWGCLCNIGM